MKHKKVTFCNMGSLQPGAQNLRSPWPALENRVTLESTCLKYENIPLPVELPMPSWKIKRLNQVPVVLLLVAFIVFFLTNQNWSCNRTLESHSFAQKGAKTRYTSVEITEKYITYSVCTCQCSRRDNYNSGHYVPLSVTDEFQPAEFNANFSVVPTT